MKHLLQLESSITATVFKNGSSKENVASRGNTSKKEVLKKRTSEGSRLQDALKSNERLIKITVENFKSKKKIQGDN